VLNRGAVSPHTMRRCRPGPAWTGSTTWDDTVKDDPPARVTWELTPAGEQSTRLSVLFDDFESENATFRSVQVA
jgi:hypothetical protein